MITVQGSNSGGVSTYTLLLNIDPEEESESTPWPKFSRLSESSYFHRNPCTSDEQKEPPINPSPPPPSIGTLNFMLYNQ